MSEDCTVVFYTANRTRESFGVFVRKQLLRSIGNLPLISVSQKPMDFFGHNICVGDIGQTHLNVYRQILIGAKEADTQYVALTEDDILYPPEHFIHRPSNNDVVAYNMNKWSYHTWVRPPTFFQSIRRKTAGAIASRQLIIDALEERFAKWPDDKTTPIQHWGEIGRERYERMLGVTVRKTEEFSTLNPVLVFFHEEALGYKILGRRKKKGDVSATYLPYWGSAKDMMQIYA